MTPLLARFRMFALVLAALAAGCASTLDISVKSRPETNDKRPFYMMVRSVSDDRDLAASYDEVADKLYSKDGDESVLKTAVLFPGKDVHVQVSPPSDQHIVIYFFFTDYDGGARWRVVLSERPIPEQVFVELGDRYVERAVVGR